MAHTLRSSAQSQDDCGIIGGHTPTLASHDEPVERNGSEDTAETREKPSPAWFDLSVEMLVPATEEKRRLTKDFYCKGGDKKKEKLVEMQRKVAGLVDAAKIRWLKKKVEEMENTRKFDPRGASKAMRDTSNMRAGHEHPCRKKAPELATSVGTCGRCEDSSYWHTCKL